MGAPGAILCHAGVPHPPAGRRKPFSYATSQLQETLGVPKHTLHTTSRGTDSLFRSGFQSVFSSRDDRWSRQRHARACEGFTALPGTASAPVTTRAASQGLCGLSHPLEHVQEIFPPGWTPPTPTHHHNSADNRFQEPGALSSPQGKAPPRSQRSPLSPWGDSPQSPCSALWHPGAQQGLRPKEAPGVLPSGEWASYRSQARFLLLLVVRGLLGHFFVSRVSLVPLCLKPALRSDHLLRPVGWRPNQRFDVIVIYHFFLQQGVRQLERANGAQ